MRLALVSILAVTAGAAYSTVIDHSCTSLDDIPAEWIGAVRTMDSHYAHTSHGSQLIYGAGFLEDSDPTYDISIGDCYLPSTPGAYCVFDGQEGVGYITPDLYWETEAGLDLTRDVLDNNPTISTSMWSWCTQCDYYSEAQVQAYLDAMTLLEGEYPDVTFIYMTGNAQATGSSGYNRWLRNQQIRNYCIANDKYLFDFEDLDSWWFDPSSQQWERHTYTYSGQQVPSEHPEFQGDEYGHTTAGSCLQKGRAWWYMMALTAGWGGTGIGGGQVELTEDLLSIAGNPAPGVASVLLGADLPGSVDLSVYDIAGRLVENLFSGPAPEGPLRITFDPGTEGVYIIRLSGDGLVQTERLTVLR